MSQDSVFLFFSGKSKKMRLNTQKDMEKTSQSQKREALSLKHIIETTGFQFSLWNGLKATFYSLDKPELNKIKEECKNPLQSPEAWLSLVYPEEAYALKINLNDDIIYLIFHAPDLTVNKGLIHRLRIGTEDCFEDVALLVYNTVAYTRFHRTGELLLNAIKQKTSPNLLILIQPERGES